MISQRIGAVVFLAAAGLVAGCAHLQSYPTTVPSSAPSGVPTALPSSLPTPASSATPQPCGTPANADEYVAMSFAIAPAGSQYGLLFGFGQVDSQGNVPPFASPIVAATSERVQFVNVDAYDPSSPTLRSAAGFPDASGFPPIPYDFPADTYSVLGTAVGNAAWSTGLISPTPATSTPCYSQPFTLSAQGIFYFGDVLYYNDDIASPRGVFTITQEPVQKVTRAKRSPLVRRPPRPPLAGLR